ncbi:MAG: glutaredoxin 3 [Cocleimonas sp.]|nr:glutaredoxin 3 [Cocleimonas sp.]
MQADVIMYSTRFCPYCMRARKLLKNKNIEYQEIFIGMNRTLREEMEQKSGRTSVPQIFINGQAIGGYDDIAQLNIDGQLDTLLIKEK